jgi:MFS family permease
MSAYKKNLQFYKFCAYGFLKNLRFFEPFLILFLKSKGISFLQIGTLYATREIVRNIMEIPSGIIADGIGKRRALIFSFLAYIFSFILFFIGKTYFLFFLAMLMYGVGDAFRSGTHKALIYTYLRQKSWIDYKVDYYGHTRAASQLGSAISALIAGAIVFFSQNYEKIFLFTLIPYSLELVLMLSYPKEIDSVANKISFGKIISSFKKIFVQVIAGFRNSQARRAVFNMSVYDAYYRAIKDFLQPVLKTAALSVPVFLYYSEKKRTAIVIAIVYFFIYIITSYSSAKSSKFLDKFSSSTSLMNISFVLGVSFGILAGLFFKLSISLLAIIFYLLIYIIQNLRKPVNIAYVSEHFSDEVMATTLSVASQLQTFISALIVVMLGWFTDILGLGEALSIISVILVFSFVFFKLKK